MNVYLFLEKDNFCLNTGIDKLMRKMFYFLDIMILNILKRFSWFFNQLEDNFINNLILIYNYILYS